jgi:hypothetical protein
MSGSIDIGVRGLSAAPGDHVCAFYRGEDERDAIMMPFLRTGLAAGNRCVCVVDTSEPSVIANRLRDDELERLDLMRSADAYFPNGRFDAAAMLAFWIRMLDGAVTDGESLVRIIAEMTWVLRDLPASDDFLAYESAFNRLAPSYPQISVCLYDLDQHAAFVMEIMNTHPKVLVDGAIHENPFYLEPDEFTARRN